MHWRSLDASAAAHAPRPPTPRRWRCPLPVSLAGSTPSLPAPPSGANRSGPVTAPRACCDSAAPCPACTSTCHSARQDIHRDTGSSPPPTETAPGNARDPWPGQSRYARTRMVGVIAKHLFSSNHPPSPAALRAGQADFVLSDICFAISIIFRQSPTDIKATSS